MVISDDNFLVNGISLLVQTAEIPLLSYPIVIVDIDRIGSVAILECYIERTPSSSIIFGISRDGIMSRMFKQVPSVSIDTPVLSVSNKLHRLSKVKTSKEFWLAQCTKVRFCKMLSPKQNAVLEGFKYGLDIQAVADITGMRSKSCYYHAREIISKLNLKNIKELRYFATLL
ncbi:hypothetical protein NNO04_08825 [Citrobacter sp. Awk 4]|uniref:hypothetical protein n=1 Tax=Citrobacter sp. Awk 4 TaxID=2963955 RepID=UPI002304234E|nr:hypothetical protein [Citrobacter sp. Awk 4]MDA8478800.1 hypothetical protein [Citrobacter sp. Awk 4]